MGLFGRKKKKDDYKDKLLRIERTVWELENKQILYLDKLKAVVKKQEEYKRQGKTETDRNMQRHYAGLYINCEREKEQIADSINALSQEIIAAGRMAQLVDTQVLTLELEKTETLTLAEISEMSDSIAAGRLKRASEMSLKNEAIDKALRVEKSGADEDVDRILGLWEEEKSAEDELKLSAPVAAADAAAAGPAEVGAGAPADIPVSAGRPQTSDDGETSGTEMAGNRRVEE